MNNDFKNEFIETAKSIYAKEIKNLINLNWGKLFSEKQKNEILDFYLKKLNTKLNSSSIVLLADLFEKIEKENIYITKLNSNSFTIMDEEDYLKSYFNTFTSIYKTPGEKLNIKSLIEDFKNKKFGLKPRLKENEIFEEQINFINKIINKYNLKFSKEMGLLASNKEVLKKFFNFDEGDSFEDQITINNEYKDEEKYIKDLFYQKSLIGRILNHKTIVDPSVIKKIDENIKTINRYINNVCSPIDRIEDSYNETIIFLTELVAYTVKNGSVKWYDPESIEKNSLGMILYLLKNIMGSEYYNNNLLKTIDDNNEGAVLIDKIVTDSINYIKNTEEDKFDVIVELMDMFEYLSDCKVISKQQIINKAISKHIEENFMIYGEKLKKLIKNLREEPENDEIEGINLSMLYNLIEKGNLLNKITNNSLDLDKKIEASKKILITFKQSDNFFIDDFKMVQEKLLKKMDNVILVEEDNNDDSKLILSIDEKYFISKEKTGKDIIEIYLNNFVGLSVEDCEKNPSLLDFLREKILNNNLLEKYERKNMKGKI